MGILGSLFGGPSPQEVQAQGQMAQTSKDMAYDSQVTFGQDQAMFQSLSSAIAPTLTAGPSQFGMSTAEEAAKRSMLSEQLSQAGQQESQMVNEALASRGITAGAGVSPGALAEIEGSLAQKYAVAQATGQLGITSEGYDIGRQNYWSAVSEGQNLLGTQANLSTNTAKIGESAGEASFNEANTINSQQGGMLKGLLTVAGDVGGSFIGNPNMGAQMVGAMNGIPVPPSSSGTENLGNAPQNMQLGGTYMGGSTGQIGTANTTDLLPSDPNNPGFYAPGGGT